MEKRTFNILGLGLLVMTVTTTVAQTVFAVLCSPSFVSTDAFTYLSVTMLYFFGLPVFWLFVRRLPVCAPEPRRPLKFSQVLLSLAYSLGVTYLFNIFGNLLMTLVSLLQGRPVPNAVENLLTSGNLLWNLVIVSFCSPIVEEFIFRKLLLDRLKPFGDRIAIFYSAVAFGLFHMNFYQFFYAAALGAIFAYLTLRTGSIRLSILLHMLVNLFGSVVSTSVMQYGGAAGTVALGLMVIGLILFTVVWSILHFKDLRLQGARFRFSRPITAGLVWLNPGTILYLLLCGAFFVANTFLV